MVRYVDDICITDRMKEAMKQTYEELKRMAERWALKTGEGK